MVVVMKVNGRIITCMARVITPGKMVVAILATTKWIRNTDLAFIPGLMAENTKETGTTENNTVKESLYFKMELLEKDFGMRVNVLDGWISRVNHNTLVLNRQKISRPIVSQINNKNNEKIISKYFRCLIKDP